MAGDTFITVAMSMPILSKWMWMLMLMALFKNSSRSYVMKELLSVGWDSQEKDKNMTEVAYFIHIQSY